MGDQSQRKEPGLGQSQLSVGGASACIHLSFRGRFDGCSGHWWKRMDAVTFECCLDALAVNFRCHIRCEEALLGRGAVVHDAHLRPLTRTVYAHAKGAHAHTSGSHTRVKVRRSVKVRPSSRFDQHVRTRLEGRLPGALAVARRHTAKGNGDMARPGSQGRGAPGAA